MVLTSKLAVQAAQFGIVLTVAALLLTQNRSAWLGAVVGVGLLGVLALRTTDGIELATRSWLVEGNPRAGVVLVHGFAAGKDDEKVVAVAADLLDFASKLDIPDITVIPVSALHGDNVVDRSENMPWYEGPPLLYHLEHVHVARAVHDLHARIA